MDLVALSLTDLGVVTALVYILALSLLKHHRVLSQQMMVAALRTILQLTLIGYVLTYVFANESILLLALIAVMMLLVASREVIARQQTRIKGKWALLSSSLSLFVSSFLVCGVCLVVVIQADPWYHPQYAIPLLGMVLGNTMTAVAISSDRLIHSVYQQRLVIEQRLMLGETANEAIADLRAESLRAGLIPLVNAMATAGVVNLPGMMTGQILSGSPPVEAVKYQILILFLIALSAGAGVVLALWMSARRLFDQRDRLNLSQLQSS